MVETIHAPETCVSTIAGDMSITDDTARGAEGPSITGSCDFLFWR
jgi:hypothetical protein